MRLDCEGVERVLNEKADIVLEETVDGPLLRAVDLTPLEVDDCAAEAATRLHTDSTTAEGYFRRSAGVDAETARLRL